MDVNTPWPQDYFFFQSIMINSELIDPEFIQPFMIPSLPACTTSINLTIVTVFLDVGSNSIKDKSIVRTSAVYRQWMKAFSFIKNPVIAFFNNQVDLEHFKAIRQKFISNTHLVKVDLTDLWAFKLAPAIVKVYAQENYPKFYPDTTSAYTCAVHSKYDLMLRAVTKNHFNTQYFTFVDIGYFRAIAYQNSPKFYLSLPKNFNPLKVTYLEMHHRFMVTVEDVFLKKIHWVAGGYFVAEKAIMMQWCEQYMRFTEKMLSKNLMNNDQTILYGMTLEMEMERNSSHVMINAYDGPWNKTRYPDKWMSLGYQSMCSL